MRPFAGERNEEVGVDRVVGQVEVVSAVSPRSQDVDHADSLLSRGYPGDGHIDFAAMTGLVREAGYDGDVEVEIFNQPIWDADWSTVAAIVAERYRELVEPYL